MSHISTTAPYAANAAEHTILRSFQSAQQGRAIWLAASTFGAYILLTAAMYVTAKISVWLTLMLAIPLSGLIVRVFVFQHDAGHNSFFRTRKQNTALGRACSLVTWTPFVYWRRIHAGHHGVWNNLQRRGVASEFYTDSMTVAEYKKLTPLGRWLYRFTHHAVIIHLLMPPVVFLLVYRYPYDTPKSFKAERRSAFALDVVLLLLFGSLIHFFGIKTVLLVHLPSTMLAAIIGIWLFSVQHRFEQSEWFNNDDWSPANAALHGTSYLKLPRLFRWFSADIGTHHVHHLRPSVPSYRLVDCHEACEQTMAPVTTLTFRSALKAQSFTLWDEDAHRMVPYPK